MKRTIKFRCWDRLENKMFGPVSLEHILMDEPYAELEGLEFMQFTGLLDKNGKEIFEGDIVKHPNGKLQEVEFMSFIHWSMEFGETETSSSEVMGNVFENPDLLSSNNGSRNELR